MSTPRLSAMVICRNEAHRIRACLESLSFCEEIVVIDSGSTDGTQAIAVECGAQVIEHPWNGYGPQKEFGRQSARGEWLLNVDADEIVSHELRTEILDVVLRGGEPGVDAYAIPFRNRFRHVWVRTCGYYPDRHVRFFRRTKGQWSAAQVHEHVIVEGATARLDGHIDHESFESVGHFIEKSSRYAEVFAQTAYADGRRATLATIAFRTLWRFLKAFFLKRGFLEGTLGLTIAGLQAFEVFQRYVRLWERQRWPIVRAEANEARAHSSRRPT